MNKIIKFWRLILFPGGIRCLRIGVAAGVEHSQVLELLRDQNFRTVVDIGANRGQFALVARKYFPSAKIFSFEPLEEPAAIYQEVFLFDPMVVLFELAIGANDRMTTIHVSKANDSSSLLPISSLQNNLFPGTAEKELRQVREKTLDAILGIRDIKKPALLKIDVQGYEKEALVGCSSLLSSFLYVYVECSFVELYVGQSLVNEVIDFLRKNGFVLVGVYNIEYDKKGYAIQGDFLFNNKYH